MKVICYGDSNAFGYDPRGYFGGRYDHPWPESLAAKTGWNIVNEGMNGRDIPKTPTFFPEDTDLLIIMLGTNDLLQFRTPEATCKKMEEFLQSLSTGRDKIMLIAPPPMKFGDWVTMQELIDNSVSLTKQYQFLAKRLNIRFLDAGEWNIPLTFDGVHFAEEGHIIFADKLYESMEHEGVKHVF